MLAQAKESRRTSRDGGWWVGLHRICALMQAHVVSAENNPAHQERAEGC
jgi:hypothetical protein